MRAMQVNYAVEEELKLDLPAEAEGNEIILYQDRRANASRGFNLADLLFKRRFRPRRS
jgi:hypothetical protein